MKLHIKLLYDKTKVFPPLKPLSCQNNSTHKIPKCAGNFIDAHAYIKLLSLA